MRTAWLNLKRMTVCGQGVLRPGATTVRLFGSSPWRNIAHRRLTIFLWVYIAQALAGFVIGFAAPFFYYFGVL
jgi:hypothetical protein